MFEEPVPVERKRDAFLFGLLSVSGLFFLKKDEEVLLIIKTKRELEGEVIKTVRQLHSYDVPEVCRG